ncbi:MAG: o-succinylbenzoate--CoA ligase [Caldilineaceae bacterium]|nr:o-succinylbenzoate--CoA ligase [Caldilineaceae bacterium]
MAAVSAPGVNWLADRAAVTPHVLALVADGAYITYGELERRVQQMTIHLAAHGVGAGMRLAVLLPNSAAYVDLIHAAARVGAILVPLNTRLTAPELAYQLAKATPRLLITDTAHRASVVDAPCPVLDVTALNAPASPAVFLPPPAPVTLESPQAIVFTSGTTGRPKGVLLTFGNHFWSATASAYRLGVLPHDRWLSCLPLYHVGGLAVVFRSCLYGTAMVLHDRFDLARFDRALDTDVITLTSLVPTMFYRLLEHRQRPWPHSLRAVLLGGAATGPALVEAGKTAGVPMAVTYGLTEAASQVATATPELVLRKPGSPGAPLMFDRVRVGDDAGNSVPPGDIGEVIVRGPVVMAGYFDEPEATAQTLRDGELFTGDVGYLDDDGDLWIVQRRRDIIVTGGENVYPAEVEAVLDGLPGVRRSCVVGLPDAEWGQSVAALVEADASGFDRDALLRQARQTLAGYKTPRLLVRTDDLPQTASGKVERRRVAELLAAIQADASAEAAP